MNKLKRSFFSKQAFAFLCCFIVINVSYATNTTASKKMDYITVPDINGKFAQDSTLFGEELNHYSGVVTFKRNDVKISRLGNLDFTYSMSYQTNFPELPGWLEEVPRIEISYGEAYSGGTTTVFRPPSWANGTSCSGKQEPLKPIPGRSGGYFDIPDSFFSTPKLIIPNQVNDLLLLNDKAGSNSTDRYITNSGWSISCYTNSVSGNEGFIAKAPNGNKYYFDVLANIGGILQRPIQGSSTDNIRLGEASEAYTADTWSQFHAIKIKEAMFVSKIEDKYGNWIKFEYDPKLYKFHYSSLEHYKSNQLSKVITSDNQVISVDFVGNIKKVTFNGRQWQYYNEPDKFIVELPTKQKWQYELDWLDGSMPDTEGGPPHCYLDYGSTSMTINIVHPTGATGRFLFDLTRIDSANQYLGGSICRSAFSLREKEISYDVNTSYNWRYDYSSNEGQKKGELVADKHRLKGTVPEDVDRYLNKTLTITLPDNSSIKEYINRDARSPFFGRINATEYYDNNSILLRETKNSYQVANDIGSKIIIRGSFYVKTSPVNITAELITDSTNRDKYETRYSDFNFFGIAQLTHEKYSNANNSMIREKYTRNTYINDYDNWVLNLPQKIYISDSELTDENLNFFIPVVETEYAQFNSSNQLLPAKRYSEGLLVDTYRSYHADGNLKKVELNAPLTSGEGNRTIEYSDYYRGTARTTKVKSRLSAKELQITKEVDDNGWVTSVTDLNGTTTGYAYDLLGRIKSVDITDDVNRSWYDTLYSWNDNTNTRTILKCKLDSSRKSCSGETVFKKTEYYDNLLRLTKIKHQDMLNSSALSSTRYQNFEYDYLNNPTFTSHVSANSDEDKGSWANYDDLGRIISTITSGVGTVNHDYLSNNRIRVTDAKGNTTTTTYQAFGFPNYSRPVKIESPEGVTTSLDIDVFGLTHSIQQTGPNKSGTLTTITERRYYDSNKRLCLITRPDVGNSVYKYSALGELVWSKTGVTNTECTNSAPSQSIFYTYDNLGSLKLVNYPDTSGDVSYERDNNGNVKTLTAGNVIHRYEYNNQNLLEEEQLFVGDELPLMLNYTYNGLQHKNQIGYPDGTVIRLKPNGFGAPTEAQVYKNGNVDLSFAKNAHYYPNGMLSSFTYGNGITHKTTLHVDSLLPKQLKDTGPSDSNLPSTVMSLTYDYDSNSNVTSIIDGQNSAYSLTYLGYDDLNRLTSTTGGSGIGSSEMHYDGFGNITYYKNNGKTLNYTYDYAKNRLSKVTGVSGRYGSIGYDSRGNITNNGAYSLTFNAANQLTTAKGNSYLYDGHNRRVKQTDGNGTSYSMYSQDGILLYREKGESITGNGINYIYLGKKLIAKYGNVTPQSVDKSRQHTRPFGESIEAPKDDVGYTGHKFDTDLGLSYMQARYYDPVIGRFYSNDPVGALGHMQRGNSIVHGFNRYAYVNNNPYKYTDPNGEFVHLAIGFAIGFVAEVGSQALQGKELNFTKATLSGVAGAVTGGISALAKTTLSVGGKVVATGMEKALAGTMVTGTGAVSAAGASAVNDSLTGTSSGKIVDNAVEAAIESIIPNGKVLGKVAGDTFRASGKQVGANESITKVVSEVASSTTTNVVNDICSVIKNSC